jgi:hypothetical protein
MAAGIWTPTNSTRTDILAGNVAPGSGYKVALVTSGSNISPSSTTWAAVTSEVGTVSTGYATGGIAVTLVNAGTTSVALYFSSNPVWTAGTANLTAHWAVLYKVGGDVVAFCLLDAGGADVTVTSTNTLTVNSNNSAGNPVFTLA